MSCRKVQREFSRYRDRLLGAPQQEKVEAHLQSCPHCGEAWEVYRRTFSLFGQKEKVAVPPQVWVHFRMNLEKEKQEGRWWREEVRSLRWWGAAAVSVATLLLVWNWTASYEEEQKLALQNFLTKSEFGKVLVVF